MASPPTNSSSASIILSSPNGQITSPPASQPARRSSSLHQNLLTKLRPLPFQYVWSVYHQKSSTDPSAASLTLLADRVPDIAAFYRVYNNFPWPSLALKDSVHVFRTSVQPLWESPENLNGGCWVLKVRREDDRALKVWEEICIMGCGGELQAAITPERDHVLGMSYSPRLYWAHISIWTKKGANEASIEKLERTVLERLSPELKPKTAAEYYYKKHSDHDGWAEAVKGTETTEGG